jgi:hypothetical protein
MENVLENFDFLKIIYTSNKKIRNILIDNASKKQINSLCEVVLNTLNGNVEIKYDDLKKLSKHKHVLRLIIKKNTQIAKKKSLLKNKSSILKFLLPKIFNKLKQNDASHSQNDISTIQPN